MNTVSQPFAAEPSPTVVSVSVSEALRFLGILYGGAPVGTRAISHVDRGWHSDFFDLSAESVLHHLHSINIVGNGSKRGVR
jgi:hypothetical protein